MQEHWAITQNESKDLHDLDECLTDLLNAASDAFSIAFDASNNGPANDNLRKQQFATLELLQIW